jgi:hypothetical protein
MEDYSEVNIKPLTRRAINKLKKGGQIKISHGEIPVRMSRAKMEQLAKKLSKGKGAFLKMSPEEVTANGEGIFKAVKRASKAVGKQAKKLATQAGDYLKSTQFKKDLVNVARPTVKGAVDAGIASLATSAIATNPELAPLIIPAAYAATYGANKLIDKPSLITGNKTYDKGGMILPMRKPRVPRMPKMPKPMGSDPITHTPKNLLNVGNGIYAGQQSSGRGYTGEHMGSGHGIFAGGQVMVTGRHTVRDVLASADPLHTQHHNQMLKQFM